MGNKIKNEFNNDVKIIYDYRDGWFSRFDRYNNNYFFSKLKSYFEDKVLKSSFKILCATKTIYQKITFKNKILLTNGYYSLPHENKNKFIHQLSIIHKSTYISIIFTTASSIPGVTWSAYFNSSGS